MSLNTSGNKLSLIHSSLLKGKIYRIQSKPMEKRDETSRVDQSLMISTFNSHKYDLQLSTHRVRARQRFQIISSTRKSRQKPQKTFKNNQKEIPLERVKLIKNIQPTHSRKISQTNDTDCFKFNNSCSPFRKNLRILKLRTQNILVNSNSIVNVQQVQIPSSRTIEIHQPLVGKSIYPFLQQRNSWKSIV